MSVSTPDTERAKPVRVLIETLLLVAVLELGVAGMPALGRSQALEPGALSDLAAFGAVCLMAARYGLSVGVGVGALVAFVNAALLASGPYPPAFGSWNAVRTWLFDLDPLRALMLVLSGGAIGSLSERHRQRARWFAGRLERCERQLQRESAERRVLEAANRELERRVVEPAHAVARLYEAARRLETLEEEELAPNLLDIVHDHLEARRSALYLMEGERLRLRAHRGEPRPSEWLEGEPLVELALKERHAMSARERVRVASEGEEPRDQPLLLAPLLGPEWEPLGVLLVYDLPFLQLTEASRRILEMLALWGARALANARTVRRLQAQTLFEPGLGVFRASRLVPRLQEEIARAERYRQPIGLLAVAVKRPHEVARGGERTLERVLAEVLKERLRRVDAVFLLDERPLAFAALLPHTNAAGASRACERVTQAIESLGIEAYEPPAPLELVSANTAWQPDNASEAPEARVLLERLLAELGDEHDAKEVRS